jgi:hypothetical protein
MINKFTKNHSKLNRNIFIDEEQLHTLEDLLKGRADLHEKVLESLNIDCLEDMLECHFEEYAKRIRTLKNKQ